MRWRPRTRGLRRCAIRAGTSCLCRKFPRCIRRSSELVFRATWRVLPDPVGFKLPFLLADLAVAAMLAGWIRSTGGRNYQVAIYAWNPLVVVEFASSGHNDALAIAACRRYAADYTAVSGNVNAYADGRGAGQSVPCRAAAAGAFPRGLAWRSCAGGLRPAGCAALAAVCVWPYRHGWREFLGMLKYYQVIFRNYHSSIYPVLLWLTGSHEIAAGVGEGVVIGLALWLAVRRADPTRAAFLLIGTVLLFAPNGYPWYFTWIVPLLCFYPSPAWLLLTILQFLSYKIFINYRALGDVAVRSVLSVAVLCAVLCVVGVGDFAEESRKRNRRLQQRDEFFCGHPCLAARMERSVPRSSVLWSGTTTCANGSSYAEE